MGRKLFTFNPVRNSLGLTFHQQAVQYPTDYAAKFNRNLILSGKSAAGEEWSPAFLKCADAIASTRLGPDPLTNVIDNEFGAVRASADLNGALGLVTINAYSPTALGLWTPGGNGVNAWAAYRLPEATLCDRYLVHTKQAEAPLGWRLEGSNTGLDEDWANIHQVDNTGEWVSAGEQKEFVIPPETRGAYLWYRLKILASNAATTRLYRLRLLRPESVCARNELLIDASASNPLVLSFADGYDDVTGAPIDYIETISEPVKISAGDLGFITTSPAGMFELYAKRDPFSGEVSFEMIAPDSVNARPLIPIMTANNTGGTFVLTGNNNAYIAFDGNNGSYFNLNTGAFVLKRSDSAPFPFNQIKWGGGSGSSHNIRCQIVNPNDSIIEFLGSYLGWASPFSYYFAKEIQFSAGGSNGLIYTCQLYVNKRFKFFAGKMHRLSDDGTAWMPVQMIRLGTYGYLPATGELVNAAATSLLQRANLLG